MRFLRRKKNHKVETTYSNCSARDVAEKYVYSTNMELKQILNGRVLLVGVGNLLKGDDAAGPIFIERCKQRKIRYETLDTATSPENFVDRIIKFDTVIIVDSVEMGESPGTIRMFSPEEISGTLSFTHDISLKVFSEYILSRKPGIKVYLIGIQPKSMKFGKGLSCEVDMAIEKLLDEICMN